MRSGPGRPKGSRSKQIDRAFEGQFRDGFETTIKPLWLSILCGVTIDHAAAVLQLGRQQAGSFNHRHQFRHYLLRCYALTHQRRTIAISANFHRRTRNKPASDLSSYECSLVAKQAGGMLQGVELVQRARTCLEATTLRDPTYAEAWASLVSVLFDEHISGMGLPSPEAEDIDKRAYLVGLHEQ